MVRGRLLQLLYSQFGLAGLLNYAIKTRPTVLCAWYFLEKVRLYSYFQIQKENIDSMNSQLLINLKKITQITMIIFFCE